MTHGTKLLFWFCWPDPTLGFGQQQPAPSLESLVADAQRAEAAGDYTAAANDYKQAVRLQAGMPQLWANLGLMQHQVGDSRVPSELSSTHYVSILHSMSPICSSGSALRAFWKGTRGNSLFLAAEKINKADPQAPLALGRVYISVARFSAAVEELDRANNMAPKLGAAWFASGISHLDLVEATRGSSEETKNRPSRCGVRRVASEGGEIRRGCNALQKSAQCQAAATMSPFRAWLCAAQNHDPSGAEKQFVAERERTPNASWRFWARCGLRLRNGDNQRAIELLNDLWDRDHGFVESNAGILLDGTLSDATATTVALFSSQESAALTPDLRNALPTVFGLSDPEVNQPAVHAPDRSQMHQTPEAYYAEGHFLACARQLELSVAPLKVEKLHLLAECAESTGNDALVLRAANALNRLQPHSAEALYWSILANERLALRSLARFQQLDPDSATSHVLLGDVYHQLERNDDAQTEYLKALKLSPGDPAALLGVATAYLCNSNLPAAAEAAQSALSKRPDDPDFNLLMAEVEFGRHDYASALPYLENILHTQAKPQMLPLVHALIGKVYAESDKTEEAIRELNLGASSDEDGSIYYLLAHLYRKQGDLKDADVAIDRMKAIKSQRRERGYKLIEDPELSSLESQPERPINP